MKKVLFSIVCLFVGVFVLNAQPILKDHVTFENGMPAGWTASNTQNVVIDQDIHSTGEKSLWMKPSSSGAVTFTSPVYNITPGHNVPFAYNKEFYCWSLHRGEDEFQFRMAGSERWWYKNFSARL